MDLRGKVGGVNDRELADVAPRAQSSGLHAALPGSPRERSGLEWLLRPVHRSLWADPRRRGYKLLRFAETEADGGRNLARASELTRDALLRRLYLRHALDEQRHAEMFRRRAGALLRSLPRDGLASPMQANWLAPGERGLDDLRVEAESDGSLLAFLHLSERAAAQRFAAYRDVLAMNPETRDVFRAILRDEAFHMNYTYAQLRRVDPQRHGTELWLARAARLWKGYLRVATAIAGVLGGVVLLAQYFLLLAPFSVLAKRAARQQAEGWSAPRATRSLESQYSFALPMNILGISAHYHDSAAALLKDGVPVAAVQQERLSRRKNDAAFPLDAIEWCLEEGRLEPGNLDAVVFYEKPMLKFERILTMALRAFPKSWSSFPEAMKKSPR